MSQYTTGTVAVTNGSAAIVGTGTSWLANVTNGSLFTLPGSGVPYVVGSVNSNTSITLSSNYAGATASGLAYSITTSYTPELGLPYPEDGDSDTATILKRAMLVLDGIKATIWTALGGLIAGGTGKTTPYDADTLAMCDSAASNATKKLTFANLKTWMANTLSLVSPSISGTAGNLYSSNYTPTITNGTNVASSTAYSQSFFTRIGGQALFDIPILIDPAAIGEFDFEVSLPVASTFSASKSACGSGCATVGNTGSITDTQDCVIYSNISGTTLHVSGYAADAAARTWRLTGRYLIE